MICGLCIKRIKISLFQVSWSDFVIFLFMKAASFNSIDSIPGYLHKDMQVIHTHTHMCSVVPAHTANHKGRMAACGFPEYT